MGVTHDTKLGYSPWLPHFCVALVVSVRIFLGSRGFVGVGGC